MKVKTYLTDSEYLENFLNKIGWENVLQIVPEHRYVGSLFVVIYKESDKEIDNE